MSVVMWKVQTMCLGAYGVFYLLRPATISVLMFAPGQWQGCVAMSWVCVRLCYRGSVPCKGTDVPRDIMACCFSWEATLSEVREQITLSEASTITYGNALKMVLQTKLPLLFLSVPLYLSVILFLHSSHSLFHTHWHKHDREERLPSIGISLYITLISSLVKHNWIAFCSFRHCNW